MNWSTSIQYSPVERDTETTTTHKTFTHPHSGRSFSVTGVISRNTKHVVYMLKCPWGLAFVGNTSRAGREKKLASLSTDVPLIIMRQAQLLSISKEPNITDPPSATQTLTLWDTTTGVVTLALIYQMNIHQNGGCALISRHTSVFISLNRSIGYD